MSINIKRPLKRRQRLLWRKSRRVVGIVLKTVSLMATIISTFIDVLNTSIDHEALSTMQSMQVPTICDFEMFDNGLLATVFAGPDKHVRLWWESTVS
jgi:hypothetical protein